jgi:hypothetical protein
VETEHDNIKMELKVIGYDDVDWIHLAQDRDQWQTLVNMSINFHFPYRREIPELCSMELFTTTVVFMIIFRLDVSVSKSFRTGRLERELQMVQLSATRCSCIAIL